MELPHPPRDDGDDEEEPNEAPQQLSDPVVEMEEGIVEVSTVLSSSSSSPPPPAALPVKRNPRKVRHEATSLMGHTQADEFDDDLFSRAIGDAGRWAYGTILVEVWLLTHDRSALIRPSRGWWIDPAHHSSYHSTHPPPPAPPAAAVAVPPPHPAPAAAVASNNVRGSILKSITAPKSSAAPEPDPQLVYQQQVQACPICRLTDEDRDDYLDPARIVPGEGLPGILWADDHNPEFLNPGGTAAFRGGGGSRRTAIIPENERAAPTDDILMGDAVDGTAGGTSGGGAGGHRPGLSGVVHRMQHNSHQPKVVWRNIKALAEDPDLPWNPRLQHLAGPVGLGWAAAVPIRHDGEKKGIVIYMARAGVNLQKLQAPANEAYLVAASNLISAALILRTPRQEAVQSRHQEFTAALRRIRMRIKVAKAAGKSLDDLVQENEQKKKDDHPAAGVHSSFHYNTCRQFLRDLALRIFYTTKEKSVTTLKKCMGGDVKPPPPFTWQQSMHTFFAVLVTLLIIVQLNQRLLQRHGPDAAIILGPFASFVACVYALTAAPASQPPNGILGQMLSMSVAIILQYIPHTFWTAETRACVSAAVATTLMVKTGLTHPPAAGSALLFALNDQLDWSNMAALLLGYVVVILVASFVNNVSPKRQYPTYWGIGGYLDAVTPNALKKAQ